MISSIQENKKINVKIIDFGTALFVDPQEKLKELLGTPYYIAPEVLMGNYTEKCDIWSIGVILFVMLSGTAPFNGDSDDDILKCVRRGKFSFAETVWESVSEQAKDLISKMLEYNPQKRISAADAYMHPWLQKKEFNTYNPDVANEVVVNMGKFCVILFHLNHYSLLKNYNRLQ